MTKINVYRNVNVRDAVVAVRPDRFGRGPVGEARIRQVDTRQLSRCAARWTSGRIARASPRRAAAASVRRRTCWIGVVATRPPVTRALPREPEGRGPAPRIVAAPRPSEVGDARPPLGQSRLERARPPRAPRFESDQRPAPRRPRPGGAGGAAVSRKRVPDPAADAGLTARPRAAARAGGAACAGAPARAAAAVDATGAPDAAGPADTAGPAPAGDTARASRARGRPGALATRDGGSASLRRAACGARAMAASGGAACGSGPAAAPGGAARRAAAAHRGAAPAATGTPGEPANRLYPGGRVEAPTRRGPESHRWPVRARPRSAGAAGSGGRRASTARPGGFGSGIDGPEVHRP